MNSRSSWQSRALAKLQRATGVKRIERCTHTPNSTSDKPVIVQCFVDKEGQFYFFWGGGGAATIVIHTHTHIYIYIYIHVR